jgi:hypothetical protein
LPHDVVISEDGDRFAPATLDPTFEFSERADGQADPLAKFGMIDAVSHPDPVFQARDGREQRPSLGGIEHEDGAGCRSASQVGELRVGVELMELIGALDGHMNTGRHNDGAASEAPGRCYVGPTAIEGRCLLHLPPSVFGQARW